MPIQPCQLQGRPGYRYGPTGTCYTYTPNSERSRKRAHDKAATQGRAIEANKRDKK